MLILNSLFVFPLACFKLKNDLRASTSWLQLARRPSWKITLSSNKLNQRSYITTVQYSPKIMHAQEVAQEVLAPQEHASGKKKLNCAFSARSSKRKEFKILSARRRKKLRVLPQTANNRKKFTLVEYM